MTGKWFFTTFVLLAALSLMISCGGQIREEGKLRAVVSIAPLEDLVRQVGGERVEVTVLVPPGASPHTYEPTPAQVRAVAEADLLVLIGVGLEFWADKLIQSAANPHLIVVDTSQGIEILETGEGEGLRGNPHIWLDPLNVIIQVEHIRDGLAKADPAHEDEYRANADRFIEELRELDREIRQRVQSWSHREFIAFHPAWVYFARRYGLIQAAVIERTPGKEPSPKEVAEIVETARRIGAKAIFAEPQFPPKAAQAIAAESGAQVLFLNPLGGPEGPTGYIEMMRYNVDQMEKALK